MRPVTDLPFTLACVATMESVERVQARTYPVGVTAAQLQRMHKWRRGRRGVLGHLGDLAVGDWLPVQIDDPALLIGMASARYRMAFRSERGGAKTWLIWRVS